MCHNTKTENDKSVIIVQKRQKICCASAVWRPHMRNCKVIFYKTEKRGQSGADGGDGGRGRFAQNYFAILQSPFCGNAKRRPPPPAVRRGRAGRL